MKVSEEFVWYIRDNLRCYVSRTLRREAWVLDGTLLKQPQVRIRFLKSKYYQTFVTIDYKKQLVRFKPSGTERGTSDEFVEEKDLTFADILNVSKVDMGS